MGKDKLIITICLFFLLFVGLATKLKAECIIGENGDTTLVYGEIYKRYVNPDPPYNEYWSVYGIGTCHFAYVSTEPYLGSPVSPYRTYWSSTPYCIKGDAGYSGAGPGDDAIYPADTFESYVMCGDDWKVAMTGFTNEDFVIYGDVDTWEPCDTHPGGDDILYGWDNDDTIHGACGDDSIYGSSGADFLSANRGNDHMWGGSGADYMKGGDGADSMYGGFQDDEMDGDKGDDYVRGEAQHDIVEGSEGQDYLHGGWGNDSVYGGNDQDSLIGGYSNDDSCWGQGDGPGEDYIETTGDQKCESYWYD